MQAPTNSKIISKYTLSLSHFFTSQTFQEALVISVSFPDVVGTFAPTIRTTLVHAIPAFRIAKNPALPHNAFAISNFMHGWISVF